MSQAVTLAGALASVGRPALAQHAAADSACASLDVGRDSVRVLVVAKAAVDSSNVRRRPPKLPPDFLPYVVEAVRMHYTPPATLPLPVMGDAMPDSARPPGTPRPRFPAHPRATRLLRVDAYFTLARTGPPRDIIVAHYAMSPPLEASVLDAIRALTPDDYGILPRGTDEVRVHLWMYPALSVDPMQQQPFFTTWLRVYPRPLRAGTRRVVRPRFPPDALRAGVADTIGAMFVVDEKGRVPFETIKIVHARYREFMQEVADAIRESEYYPATVDGCAVKSFTAQEFFFGY
jgi:hypothetical protein